MIQRNRQFNLRLSSDEFTAIESLAIDLALTKSNFIRLLLRQYVNKIRLVSNNKSDVW